MLIETYLGWDWTVGCKMQFFRGLRGPGRFLFSCVGSGSRKLRFQPPWAENARGLRPAGPDSSVGPGAPAYAFGPPLPSSIGHYSNGLHTASAVCMRVPLPVAAARGQERPHARAHGPPPFSAIYRSHRQLNHHIDQSSVAFGADGSRHQHELSNML